MEDSQLVTDVVQKQATVGDIINDHINGVGGYAIAEKYGLDPKKVQEIVFAADAAGKFIPKGAEVPVDKVSDTPEPEVAPVEAVATPAPAVDPIVEGENPEPPAEVVAADAMMTTKNSV